MTFFSLFHGEKVQPAAGVKILPAEQFSALIDVQALMQKTEAQCKELYQQTLKECQELKEEAKKEGFAEGLKEWTDRFVLFEERVVALTEKYEKATVSIAIQAAKKIVGDELATQQETLVKIIKQGLKSVRQHQTFQITVNPKDLDAVDSHRPQLKEGLEFVKSLTVQGSDDVKQGNAMISTEKGIINLDLENLWQALENAFFQLLKKSS